MSEREDFALIENELWSLRAGDALDRIQAHIEALLHDRDEYMEALTERMLTAERRIEALEGALREGYRTSTGGWFIEDGDAARAALAGDPPNE